MQNNTNRILFALLRCALSGNMLTEQARGACTDDEISILMRIARKHDIAHLVAHGLDRNGLLTDSNKEFGKEIIAAMYRSQRLSFDFQNICTALEAAQVPFIPLKGAVLRQLYPEAWMRTSVDVDILIHEADLDRAAAALLETCCCTCEKKGSHDVLLWTKSRLCLELHYSLLETGNQSSYAPLLAEVWSYAVPRPGYVYWQEMDDAMFYFYHLAHMAKHFEGGGCGIRPFIDLWILDQQPEVHAGKQNELLQSGGLLQFAEAARKLSRVWLAGEDHTALTAQMEQFIIRGGMFGSMENSVVLQQQRKGSKVKYLLSRIFLPYDTLKFQFPCLQKHKWLTPLFQIVRWFRLLLPGRGKKALRELTRSSQITEAQAQNMQQFLENLGL